MSNNITLSIDVMGGQDAPHAVISGLDLVCKNHSDVNFLLCGKSSEFESLVLNTKYLKNRYEIIECAMAISDHESPVKAVKNGSESSMRAAIDAVKYGKSQACVSGGNTGALMVMSKMRLGMLTSIKRPAIISIFPNRKNGTIMLDLGANAECDSAHILQFAIMGICFAKVLLKNNNPTLGILNMGTEKYKGREIDKKSAELFSKTNLNYIGFIEGHQLSDGSVDVVVTDGFTGNVALKVAEGVAKTCIEYMKRGFKNSILSILGSILAAKGLRQSFSIIDPRKYNGAMFIGLNGIVIKSHGSSDSISFANAVDVAISAVKKHINNEITSMIEDSELQNLAEHKPD